MSDIARVKMVFIKPTLGDFVNEYQVGVPCVISGLDGMVGLRGFEPPASVSQALCTPPCELNLL